MKQRETEIFREKGFSIGTESLGAYDLVTFRGEYRDALQSRIALAIKNAEQIPVVDFSELAGISMALTRELINASRTIHRKGYGKGLILLNPPDKLVENLTIVNALMAFYVVPTRDDLPSSPEELTHVMESSRELLDRIQREMRRNPVWHMIDRDKHWLCPFCGALQRHITVGSYINPSQDLIDKVYEHLNMFCPPFQLKEGVPLAKEKLSGILDRINVEKFEVSVEETQRLKEQIEQYKHDADRHTALERALENARKRQHNLLPAAPPEIDGAEFGIFYKPAEHVSGDFYDFVCLESHRTGIVIGDVTGHGIEAAIVMGMAKKVIQMRLNEKGSIREALLQANADVYPDLSRQMFISAFVGVYNSDTHEFEFVRAGHPPPILVHPGQEGVVELLEARGVALGLDSGEKFNRMLDTGRVNLQPGDMLLCYTDGVLEASDENGDEFGLDRLQAICREHADQTPNQLLGVIWDQVASFNHGELEDDVTMTALKIL